MSIVVSVRLPAPLVQRLDEIVDEGLASTRAEVVWRALEREFRHLAAASDAAVLGRIPNVAAVASRGFPVIETNVGETRLMSSSSNGTPLGGGHGYLSHDIEETDDTIVSVLPRRAWVE